MVPGLADTYSALQPIQHKVLQGCLESGPGSSQVVRPVPRHVGQTSEEEGRSSTSSSSSPTSTLLLKLQSHHKTGDPFLIACSDKVKVCISKCLSLSTTKSTSDMLLFRSQT